MTQDVLDAKRFNYLIDRVNLTISRNNLKSLFSFNYWGTKEEIITAIDKSMKESK